MNGDESFPEVIRVSGIKHNKIAAPEVVLNRSSSGSARWQGLTLESFVDDHQNTFIKATSPENEVAWYR